MKMKQIKTEDGAMPEIISKKVAKPSIRKVGTVLGSGALCVLTIGTISIIGLLNQNANSIQKNTNTAVTTNTTTTDESETNTYTSINTIAWKKANIFEYDIAETETTTTTTTKAQTTTTAKKVTEKDIDDVEMMAVEIANIRVSPDEDADISAMMAVDEYATVTAKTSNGWYAVEYYNYTGYVLQSSLTKTTPNTVEVQTTSAVTTVTTQKATEKATEKTTKNTEKSEKTTTTTTTAKNEVANDAVEVTSVISYTDEEFEMLTYVLQGEVGNCSDESKIAVANVIINRVKSKQFPDSISGVLTAHNQFTAISGYYNKTTPPNKSTIDCAKRALAGEDNSNGATFYYAPQYCSASTASWFESLELCATIENQRYFKNW